MSDSQGIPTSEFFCTQGPAARALGRSEQQALSSLLRPKHTHTHTHAPGHLCHCHCLPQNHSNGSFSQMHAV